MTLLVRDEAPLVGPNIAYHLSRGVDHVIATDHRSVDGTDRILRDFERQGVLDYIREDGECFDQDIWVTRMARMAAERHAADWVFHVDADEFWWPERGQSLKDIFTRIPDGANVLQAPRSNFVAVEDTATEHQFHQTMRYRQRVSLNPLGKPLPGKVAHRGVTDLHIELGNHHASLNGERIRAPALDDVLVLHFPLRTVDQYRGKIRMGGAALECNTRLPSQVGSTWRQQLRMEEQGELDAHLRRQFHDSRRIEDGLANGELIEDERFADYMASLLPLDGEPNH